jgi:hypothetical protein
MNMVLLTGLSVALALSIITSNNFYADKVTNTSINHFNKQASYYATNIINNFLKNNPLNNDIPNK